MKTLKFISLFLLLVIATGCFLHPPYERAAVVIVNDTSQDISYEVYSQNSWSTPTQIKPRQSDFILQYDIIKSDAEIPDVIEKIKITAPTCKIILSHPHLKSLFKRDPQGRAGWNLYIDKALISSLKCI